MRKNNMKKLILGFVILFFLASVSYAVDVTGIKESGGIILYPSTITDGQYFKRSGSSIIGATPTGTGDVVGPAGGVSTGDVVGFDGITGKLIKKITSISGVTLGGFTASKALCSDGSGNAVACTNLTDVIPGIVNNIGTFAAPITTNPYTLTAANSYNSSLWYGATGTVNLPVAVAGMNIIIYNTGAFTLTIDPNGTDVVVRDGNIQAGGVSFTLSSGAGNYVALVCDAANHWVTLWYKGTLTQGT